MKERSIVPDKMIRIPAETWYALAAYRATLSERLRAVLEGTGRVRIPSLSDAIADLLAVASRRAGRQGKKGVRQHGEG